MLKFLRKNLPWLSLSAVLLACVGLLVHRADYRAGRGASLKGAALTLWLPVQKTVAWAVAFPENTLNAVRELRTLREEVHRLELENQSLRLDLSNHKSVETELSRLREVLQLKAHLAHSAKIARIIAHDPSTWNNSFVVDLGSDDGIQPDSPVISEQGVVGRVLEVTARNSRVLLLTDSSSSVAGLDSRSRVGGITQGTGRNQLRFSYVAPNEDVQKDDPLVSSGLGGVFPKGYAIGSVVKKTESENGLNTEIDVAPAVDFAALDYVFILPPVDVYQ